MEDQKVIDGQESEDEPAPGDVSPEDREDRVSQDPQENKEMNNRENGVGHASPDSKASAGLFAATCFPAGSQRGS